MQLTREQGSTVFQLLCEYRRYKTLFPQVILNVHHRDPRPAGMEELDAVLAGFRQTPDESGFTALFDLLQGIDRAIDPSESREMLFDDGILRLGGGTWRAFSLVPGEYPFANLRFIELSAEELASYRATPVVSFPNDAGVNVATCCLRSKAFTEFDGKPGLHGGEYGLIATGLSHSEAQAAEIGSCLDWARQARADVVLFPELSVDAAGRAVVEAWIGKLAVGGDLPGILVAGSFYAEVEGSYRNRATIYLTGRQGDAPFHQLHYDKRVPFSMTVPSKVPTKGPFAKIYSDAKASHAQVLVEDFVSGSAVTLVPTSHGTFGFAICRDVLDLAGVGNPLERYLNFVDFVMIISFNDGVTNLFEAQGEDLARWHNCAVVYVNAGQAIAADPDNDVVKMAYGLWPFDRASSGVAGQIYYGKAPPVPFGHLGVGSLPADGNVLHAIKTTP